MEKHIRTVKLYDMYKSAMKSVGRRVSLPADTDFVDTYQFRWIDTFATRLDGWGFDDEMANNLINEMVKYAKRNNLLDRGAAILNFPDLLEICRAGLEQKIQEIDHEIESLKKSKELIRDNVLSDRPDGKLCNLTHWYASGKISVLYLAFSKACIKTLDILAKEDPTERDWLPSSIELYRLRIKVASDKELLKDIKKVMNEDMVKVEVLG